MAEVTIENVTKIFPGGVKAVDQINLALRDESFAVLVGPSGCGKTTTLRMVAGLEEITDGTIRIGGHRVNDVPPKDRDIAMVFQNYALYPHMTVYKNMAFGLKLRRVAKSQIDRRVRAAAALLGIEQLLHRKPRALSGGQRQRVAVGRAIVRDPACFLFDEPLSNLDARLRIETRAELKRLHHRLRTTTIYVTHDQEEAMTLGDQVVVMNEGRIQQSAAPLKIFNEPVNRFVAGFVGTPPMNFFDGTIQPGVPTPRFEGAGISIPLGPRQTEAVAPRVGQPAVLGIRPEGLRLQDHEPAGRQHQPLEVTVNVVEPLGSTMDLYCASKGQQTLVARVTAQPFTAPATARLLVNLDKLFLFENGPYGRNLLGPDYPW